MGGVGIEPVGLGRREDEDASADAGGAERERLGERGDGEGVDVLGFERAGDGHRAVAVGVGLDDGHQPRGRGTGGEVARVGAEGAEVDAHGGVREARGSGIGGHGPGDGRRQYRDAVRANGGGCCARDHRLGA